MPPLYLSSQILFPPLTWGGALGDRLRNQSGCPAPPFVFKAGGAEQTYLRSRYSSQLPALGGQGPEAAVVKATSSGPETVDWASSLRGHGVEGRPGVGPAAIVPNVKCGPSALLASPQPCCVLLTSACSGDPGAGGVTEDN